MESASSTAVENLRAQVQRFVRNFGLLAPNQTPCGKPLSPSHAHCLMVLLEAGRAARDVSQQDLVRALGIDKSNVARLCARMVRAGHIRQERGEADGRSRWIRLTSAGSRLAANVESASRGMFERLYQAVPAVERDALCGALEKLNEAVLVVHGAPSEKETR